MFNWLPAVRGAFEVKGDRREVRKEGEYQGSVHATGQNDRLHHTRRNAESPNFLGSSPGPASDTGVPVETA